MNWHNIDYLKTGNSRQKRVYDIIIKSHILETLSQFTPVIVSTICVGLDIDSSDIDIICSTTYPTLFEEYLQKNYSNKKAFNIKHCKTIKNEIVCSFFIEEFEIEIFAAPDPVEEQNAYKHLTVMKRLVTIGGKDFCNSIRTLKQNGLKTEPAIAKQLNLNGNPFTAVLELATYNKKELVNLLNKS